MNAYRKAQDIEKLIVAELDKLDNDMERARYIRTIKSSLALLETALMSDLLAAQSEHDG